ncbi:hypothetical protein [Cellvibrio sp. QJXJ]|uniref:hypothetical protein n=1 Tax=Cellvibrio sp. QJXJ TaxID=2964606 RepID=UPI0021C3ABD5|nr:hypothetical protein [Cellvibrio sp. QJXJ]UUA75150.1 hypothetical protein NNX04_22090 [Cellvibrio sp. QJXJ]
MITEDTIVSMSEEIKTFCVRLFPRSWSVTHTSFEIAELEMNRNKIVFGKAHHCGKIQISNIYVGTDCYSALKSTLIHEFSHLIVGLKENHNSRFKRIFEYLSDKAEMDTAAILKDHDVLRGKANAIKPCTLQLWMVFQNGDTEFVGNYQKRSKKYTAYDPSVRNLQYKGKLIDRFYYTESPTNDSSQSIQQ